MEIRMADAIQWDKVMGKKVRSIDGEDVGKVENVNTDAIEVKDGLIAKSNVLADSTIFLPLDVKYRRNSTVEL
jgi:sporulation protein YlmC with PRC-barrel domain